MTKLRAVDLFCGAGGFAHGMQKAGIKIVRSMDHDTAVIDIHSANIKHVETRLPFRPPPIKPSETDGEQPGKFRRGQIHKSRKEQHVADLTAVIDIAPEVAHDKPDIIFGGPPCQAFSSAGKGGGDSDPRSSLTEAFAIIIAAARPRYFVMENVKGIRKSETYKRAVAVFRRVGYGLSETVVNATHFGTPQARERLILAGCLNETDGWFHSYLNQYKTPAALSVADVLGPEFGMVLSDAVLDPDSDAVAKCDLDGYPGYRLRATDLRRIERGNPETRYYHCTPGGASSASIHRTDRPAPTLIRTSVDGLSRTYRPIAGDPVDLRKIAQPAFEQFSRLAGYPAGWNWGTIRSEQDGPASLKGTLLGARQRQLMLANSVPPPLAYAIGRAIVDHEARKIPSEPVEARAIEDAAWRLSARERERYSKWLTTAKGLVGRALTKELSDLRGAKRLVANRKLVAASEELKALEGLPATSGSNMTPARKAQLRRALANLAEFEFYQSYVRSQLFPDDDEAYARGDLERMLDPAEPRHDPQPDEDVTFRMAFASKIAIAAE